jgi:murein DD-endopeptidase MepM/ murein hydrolase activator NlpD
VIHVVQQGDTLFGISIEYGVSVDALISANGLDENDFLRIGQALIIPLGVEEEPSRAVVPADRMILPTPTPLPLEVENVALYETPVGGLLCMGEVVNTFDEPVTNLQVEVSLLAPDDSRLATAITLAAADYLDAGGRAPFSFLFADSPSGVDDVSVRVLRAEAISPITADFVSMEIRDGEGEVSGPQYRIQGSVANVAGQVVERVTVVTIIYDDSGAVMGYRQESISAGETLAPGASWRFEILLTPQGLEPPSSFRILSWAVIAGG